MAVFKTSKTYWQWTEVAEARWTKHEQEPRRNGQPVMELSGEGERAKRKTVPLTWVSKGYVKESPE